MVVNMITDLTYSQGYYKVVGFYLTQDGTFAKRVSYSSFSGEKSISVINFEKDDLNKKYGPSAKQAWYQFEISQEDFDGVRTASDSTVCLTDSSGETVNLDFTAYSDRKELDKKINTFLAVSNRYAIQGNDVARALAYWMLISEGIESLTKESAPVIHLYSLIAATLNDEGINMPEVGDWVQIEARCCDVFKNQRMRYFFVLFRIAISRGFENDLINLLRSSDYLNAVGHVESKLVYVVALLKSLILRVGEGTDKSMFIDTDEVAKLFKAALMNTDKEDYLTVEVSEKLSTVSAIYHRIYWTKNGKDELRFTEKEFTATCRKLFIASFGALGEREINMFRQIEV